jgi:hypothetical protein
MNLLFVLVDESTVTDARYGGQLTTAVVGAMAAALTTQLNRDVAPAWGGSYGVRVGKSGKALAKGEIACAIVDDLPDAPGAIAYHDVDGSEVPTIFLARRQCNSLLSGPDSVSSAMSHELCETVGDPFCNEWADDGQGHEYAKELCDAVQETGYVIGDVAVSNFLLPAFFAPGASGPYDFLGTAAVAPFHTAPGGYQIVRPAGGAATQVLGRLRDERLAKKRHPTSRTYRRGARL